ncbi:MAG: hypothetical protein AAF719_13210 [Pseudomonadota bacterium]
MTGFFPSSATNYPTGAPFGACLGMVEKQRQTAAVAPKRASQPDWLAREMDYRAGMSSEDMAARYGVSLLTARNWASERGWTAPLSAREHRAKLLTSEIAAAERALALGDFSAAERRMRAAMAIEKAVRTLADIDAEVAQPSTGTDKSTGINNMDVLHDAQSAEDEFEGGYKAELRRRLLRIIEAVERKSADGDVVGDAEPDGSSKNA